MQVTKVHTLQELQDARDAGKVIEEAYYGEGMLTPKGYAVNPTWNKRFTKSLDRYRIVEEVPSEIFIREYATDEIVDMLFNVYKIDKSVAISYIKDTNEFMDNVMDRIDEAIIREVEELVSATNILQHQKIF